MAKKTYETPVADLLIFDYQNNVTASGYDASHCFYTRNQGQCAPKNQNKCNGVTGNPGECNG